MLKNEERLNICSDKLQHEHATIISGVIQDMT